MRNIINQFKLFVFISALIFIILPIVSCAQKDTNDPMKEIAILQEKVDLIQDINARILNTIYWTIGALVTLFAAVMALNIFSNYRLNKRKFDDLEDEMENSIRDGFKDLDEKIEKSLKEKDKIINSEIEKKTTQKTSNIEQRLTKIKDDYKELLRDSLWVQVEKHKKFGQAGEILCMIEILEIDIEKDWDWRINETLEKVDDYVKNHKLHYDTATSLKKALDKLSPDYLTPKEQIEKNIEI